MDWLVRSFEQLDRRWLYRAIQARQEVFTVEQQILCQDLDDLDFVARHVLAIDGDRLAAYARILGPGTRYAEPSIGRVLTSMSHRRTGLGVQLVQRCIDEILRDDPRQTIRISAQAYLQEFYGKFGFAAFGDPYIEDGIDHIAMRRTP